MTKVLLRYALLAGVAYFCAMAVAHFVGFKYPLLFIYYDVPFYEYQDKIISFCAFTYACLFYAAANNKPTVPCALLALFGTVVGLSAVNLSSALERVLNGRSTAAYWIQTALIGGYLLVLTALHMGVDGKRRRA